MRLFDFETYQLSPYEWTSTEHGFDWRTQIEPAVFCLADS